MKKYFEIKYLLIILSIGIILFSGCDKDPFDLFDDFKGKTPVISTDSIYLLSFDSVVVFSHIVSKGGSDIEIAGLCFDNQPNPSEISNQLLFNSSQNNFATIVTGLDEDSTYYFKTFAANSFGSVKGNIISFTVPSSKPPVAPCVLPAGKITDNGFSYTVGTTYSGSVYAYLGSYGIIASLATISGQCDYSFDFNEQPVNGIYTVNAYNFEQHNKRSISMFIRYSFERYRIKDGGKIYIEQIEKGSGKYKISFCDLSYTPTSTTFKTKGSFNTQ